MIIGVLIVIGIFSLVSSVFLTKLQPTSTKAVGSTACASGLKEGDACTLSGEWCITCLARRGPCNSDAGVGHPYQCQNGKWKMTNGYGECNLTCSVASASPGANTSTTNTTSPAGSNSGLFHLTEEAYTEKIGTSVKFNVHVKFNSDGCDGDIMLYRDGGHVAGPNGWNIKMGPFDYDQQFAGSFIVDKGKSTAPLYRGTVDRCPKSPGQLEDTVQCTLSVDNNGNPNVSGCTTKNLQNTSTVTTTNPATLTGGAPTNRCPDGTGGVSCKPSCGGGEVELKDRPCISFWDKCCAQDNAATQKTFPTISQQSLEKDIEVDISKDAIPAFVQTHAAIRVCDYFGTTNLGRDDIRNCQGDITWTEKNGKMQMKLKIKQNQKQLMCFMITPGILGEIPAYCVPVN